jgi:hypothetical protein
MKSATIRKSSQLIFSLLSKSKEARVDVVVVVVFFWLRFGFGSFLSVRRTFDIVISDTMCLSVELNNVSDTVCLSVEQRLRSAVWCVESRVCRMSVSVSLSLDGQTKDQKIGTMSMYHSMSMSTRSANEQGLGGMIL